MTLSVSQKVAQLKAERALVLKRQEAQLVAQPSVQQVEPQTFTAQILGGLIKWDITVPTASPSPTDIALREDVGELKSVLAGQSAELAQLRQAVLVLAKSAKSVEESNLAISDGIDVIKQQTRKVIRPFSACKKEMDNMYRGIIDDTLFLNQMAGKVAVGRVLRGIMSFGTGLPEAEATARREVYQHVKSTKAMVDRISALYEYCNVNHSNELNEWLKTYTDTLVVGKKHWKFQELFAPGFFQEFTIHLNKRRGIPN